ncbi:MAG: hypothetical protein GW921_05040 [Gallionella sp.]|nr:hypothetical protein [Gallionella sp.]
MTQQPDNDKLPCLTEIVSDSRLDDLPILTEIIIDAPVGDLITGEQPLNPAAATAFQPVVQEIITAAVPRTLTAEDMQLLLQPIEAHLETVFTSKLNSQLEQLQKLAVDLAVSEFKAKLPQLLHDALNKTDESGKW